MSRTVLATLLLATMSVTACNSDERIASRYCETVAECCLESEVGNCQHLATQEECTTNGVELLEDPDNTCADEQADLLDCIGRLSCDEYDDYWEEPTEDYPCAAEDDAVIACS